MQSNFDHIIRSRENVNLEINKVLRNTYMLLSLTIFFSSVIAFLSMNYGTRISPLYFFLSFFVFSFLINLFKDSFLGLVFVFLFTGFLGYAIGPVLNIYLSLKNGKELVIFALFSTGSIFSFLSLYVLVTKKNFDFLRGFLFIGVIIVCLSFIFSLFFSMPLMHLLISGFIVILSSGFILYDTSRVVNGGETNYILATVSLYLNIYNLFMSLLHLFGFLSDRD